MKNQKTNIQKSLNGIQISIRTTEKIKQAIEEYSKTQNVNPRIIEKIKHLIAIIFEEQYLCSVTSGHLISDKFWQILFDEEKHEVLHHVQNSQIISIVKPIFTKKDFLAKYFIDEKLMDEIIISAMVVQ